MSQPAVLFLTIFLVYFDVSFYSSVSFHQAELAHALTLFKIFSNLIENKNITFSCHTGLAYKVVHSDHIRVVSFTTMMSK